ncbi:MAG: CPBP family intramembrane metalloprotease [Actinomycetia bacterium]|nr:CPBP family intramembrane metalloprotease [Actinomycetes bacterium]
MTPTPRLDFPKPATIDHGVVGHYSRLKTFYGFSIAVPWVLWLVAGWISRLEHQTPTLQWVVGALGLGGLLVPVLVAGWLVARDPWLRRDALERLGATSVTAPAAVAAVVLMPLLLVMAVAISLLVGGSPDQLALKLHSSVVIGIIPGWVTVTVAPLLEELAWHSYGTDALTARWSLWRSTWVFAIFWALWHLPLSAVQGSYQAEVAEVGVLASINFLFSVWPFMICMNWLYYRSGRSIWVAVVFHLVANVGNEIIAADPDTKIIQTLLLLPLCGWVLWHDRALFFTRPEKR